MGFMSFGNASSEHNLVPWRLLSTCTQKTHEVLYCTTCIMLHHGGKRCSREVEGKRNIRGHSTPLQIFTTLDHTHILHH